MEMEQVIERLDRIAKEKNCQDGDYIKDGLLYCGKCNTPKQSRIQFFFGERICTHMCQCQKEEKEAREEAERKAAFERDVAENRRICFSDSVMMNARFETAEDSESTVMTAARNYAKDFDGMMKRGEGLLLFGKTGTGKTFAAACIANYLLDRGYKVRMTNFATIESNVNGMWEGKQEYFDDLNRCALLIIDDLAAERKTDYMNEIVNNVINNRYNSGLPLIVTTNLTSDALKHPADIWYQRTFSRLYEMCTPIEVTGRDKRELKLIKEIEERKRRLGI